MQNTASDEIIARALDLGADAAGITTAEEMASARSYTSSGRQPGLPPKTSILVTALAHPADRPELDWWDGDRGTPGNRKLIEINLELCAWLGRSRGIDAGDLPYYVQAGGVFLKDAAVLAGLGVIGKNNLLITPGLGVRVRLRAVLIDRQLAPSAPLKDFSPCDGCPEPCAAACPRQAFSGGAYSMAACRVQMTADEEKGRAVNAGKAVKKLIRYCRKCELACPV